MVLDEHSCVVVKIKLKLKEPQKPLTSDHRKEE